MDERLLYEGADAQRGGKGRTVLQTHLLCRVVGGEAQVRPATEAGAALPAHRPPVEYDVVAGLNVSDTCPDLLDDSGCLVAEEERELLADATLAVMQVGMADAAGLNPNDSLAWAWVWNDDHREFDRCASAPCYHALN